MKKISLVLAFLLVFLSCKNETKTTIETDYSKENLDVTTSVYPENISKVFKAHGGLNQWENLQTLVFEIEKEGQNERTTTALQSRKSLIETASHDIGFNGKAVWLNAKSDKEYKGNAKFYYNLMFYFYAMPFVLADDGITYTNVDPLVVDELEYPGIRISYEAGVGESPDDEYILYYDKATNKMAWLGYTVTYGKNEKNTDFHFINYNKWQTVDGFLLPSELTWYKNEGFTIGEKRSTRTFVNIKTSKTVDSTIFEAPKEAKIIE